MTSPLFSLRIRTKGVFRQKNQRTKDNFSAYTRSIRVIRVHVIIVSHRFHLFHRCFPCFRFFVRLFCCEYNYLSQIPPITLIWLRLPPHSFVVSVISAISAGHNYNPILSKDNWYFKDHPFSPSDPCSSIYV